LDKTAAAKNDTVSFFVPLPQLKPMSLLEDRDRLIDQLAEHQEEIKRLEAAPPGPAPQGHQFDTLAEYQQAVKRHELATMNHRGALETTKSFIPALRDKIAALDAEIAALRKTLDPKFVALEKEARQWVLAMQNLMQAQQRFDAATIDLVKAGATKLHPRAGANLVAVPWVDLKIPEILVNAEEYRVTLSTWQAPPSLPDVRPLPDAWEEKASA
jgi:septal ring factor EnvC (AmiA/AmiB activator)